MTIWQWLLILFFIHGRTFMASFINNRLNKLERVIIFYYKEEEYMISVKDMAGLGYVYDAYITINKALF